MQHSNRTLNDDEVSFRERSTWVSLVAIALAFGYYFAGVLAGDGKFDASLAIRFLVVTFVFVLVQAAAQSSLATLFANDALKRRTEVDRRAELPAHKVAYFVQVTGVFTAFALMLVGTVMPVSTFLLFNTVLFFFVLAELGKYATLLVMYRRARPSPWGLPVVDAGPGS